MSAEVLRRAAALMRERAQAATPGPWESIVLGSEGYAVLAEPPADSPRRFRIRVSRNGWEEWETDKGNAAHIASWHPAVAVAVADWLDIAGADLWAYGPLCECGTGCDACDDNLWEPHARAALVVARTYLGEQP